MIYGRLYNATTTPSLQPTFESARMPFTGDEVQELNRQSAVLNDQFDSDKRAWFRAHEEEQNRLYDLFRQVDTSFKPGNLAQESKVYFNEPSPHLGNRIAYNQREAQYAKMAEYADKYGVDMPDYNTYSGNMELRGQEIASDAYDQMQLANMYNISTSPRWRAALGSVHGTVTDPVLLGATILTAPFMGVTGSVLRAAGAEALVGMVTEAAIQLKRNQWYASQGRDLSAEEIATSIVISAGASGAIAGTLSGLFKLTGVPNSPVWGIPESLRHGPSAQVKYFEELHQSGYGMTYDPTLDQFVPNDPPTYLEKYSMDLDASQKDKTFAEAFDVAIDTHFPVGHPGRPYAQGAYADYRLSEYAPIPGKLDDPIKVADEIHYNTDRARLQALHAEDLQQAIMDIQAGRVPSPVNTRQMSAQIGLSDVSDKKVSVRDLLASKVKLDSPRAQRLINQIVEAAYRDKWQPTVDNMGDLLPPDGSKAVNTVEKPKGSMKQAQAKLGKYQAEIDKANVKRGDLAAEEVEWHQQMNRAQRAAGRGEDVSDKELDKLFKRGQRIKKEQDALEAGEVKRQGDLRNAADLVEAHNRYAAGQVHADRLNEVWAARKNLQRLDDGKVPQTAEFKAMKKTANKAMQEARKAVKNEEMLPGVDFTEFTEPWRIKADPWLMPDANMGVKQGADEVVRARDEAAEASVFRMADDEVVEVSEDGKTTLTASTLKRQLEERDDMVDALKSCGVKPKPEAE